MYDCIIIGSGYGGLSIAALLQKKGLKTLILESHSLIGGCASYYKRNGFLFDVGATTFSGVRENEPIGIISKELEIKPNFKKLEIGMKIYQEDKIINRFADREKWLFEIESHFPEKNMLLFWKKIFKLNDKAWSFISENKFLPPRNLLDFIRLIKLNNFQKLDLLPNLFYSVSDYLKSYKINSIQFINFLNEQLLITTQSKSDIAPMLTSSMGLSYPSETYYPIGGMYKFGEQILNKFKELGGEILFKKEVNFLEETNFGFKVSTKSKEEFNTKKIFSNLPIWNMKNLTKNKLKKYFSIYSNKYFEAPGAFVINLTFKKELDLDTNYFQVHIPNMPYTEAGAVFITISDKEDLERAPNGFHTLTLSTHTNTSEWFGLDNENYKEKKFILQNFILDFLKKNIPQFKDVQFENILSATPKTYLKYTKREDGKVGGIPHSIYKNLLFLPSNTTPNKNLFLVGDTVFPGQGTPAVILSSLNAFNRFIN